jgi:UDP-N-acetylmuramoyl-tripeptide--D-alanyl-D-alanine ligase
MEFKLILAILIFGTSAVMFFGKRSKDSLHMVQLEGYDTEHYLKWLKVNKKRAYRITREPQAVKKPLVMTERATRLYRANLVLSVLLYALPVVFIGSIIGNITVTVILAIASITAVLYFQPLILAASTMIMKPVEERINRRFYESAQKKIKNREDLKVVGITGSFGKTSTKFIVGTILSEKFKVLNTPESYNTPMGLSKVINNELTKEHEVFIAEMGAKVLGEIRELAELAQPKIGILTSIGPVHIETFKNIDNIMKTKYELIEELPTDGVAVFNYDNNYIKKLADKTFKEKMLYGIEDKDKLDIYAEDIVVTEDGSTFTLRDNGGNSITCTTKLLGKHNIYNLLAGACAAKILGLSFDEIARGISRVEPIEHRLNLIKAQNGVIIIDDAFNSNPIGTKAALEVLGSFRNGKKIIITPGMIELGDMEESANREFGINIGKVCDYAILVGEKRTKPIYEGLMESNFKKDNIIVVNSLSDATLQLGRIAKPGDVVLFENDLPDNYNE